MPALQTVNLRSGLSELLALRGISLNELARRAEQNPKNLHEMLARNNVQLCTLERWALALEMSAGELLIAIEKRQNKQVAA